MRITEEDKKKKIKLEFGNHGFCDECCKALRSIADTKGFRNDLPLTQEQISKLVSYAKNLGFSEDNI